MCLPLTEGELHCLPVYLRTVLPGFTPSCLERLFLPFCVHILSFSPLPKTVEQLIGVPAERAQYQEEALGRGDDYQAEGQQR